MLILAHLGRPPPPAFGQRPLPAHCFGPFVCPPSQRPARNDGARVGRATMARAPARTSPEATPPPVVRRRQGQVIVRQPDSRPTRLPARPLAPNRLSCSRRRGMKYDLPPARLPGRFDCASNVCRRKRRRRRVGREPPQVPIMMSHVTRTLTQQTSACVRRLRRPVAPSEPPGAHSAPPRTGLERWGLKPRCWWALVGSRDCAFQLQKHAGTKRDE